MEKIIALLKKLGIELTADQQKQLEEVGGKEFVSAADAAKTAAELESLRKQLSQRDKDLAKLKSDTSSADLKEQLDKLDEKYKADTKALQEQLNAQAADFAAERYLDGFKFASDRVRKSVAADFKAQGFKLGEDGRFVGGEEYMQKLRETEPDTFAQDKPLLTGSTQSNVSIESNNIESQIMSGFGLT